MLDVITLFNQLTHDELADYSLFEKVLESHYEKFKYFYRLMENISLEGVNKIRCSNSDSPGAIEFRIDFESNKNLREFNKEFSNITKTFKGYPAKYFSVDIKVDKKSLYITIENKNICSEEDIYEDRFNSN